MAFVSSRPLLGKSLSAKLHHKTQRFCALFLIVFLSGVIGLALGFEYLGNYPPCSLCLIERIPYYGALPFLIAIVFLVQFFDRPSLVRISFLCVFTLMILNLILGLYHVGLEYGFWVELSQSCLPRTPQSITETTQLLNHLNDTPPLSCATPQKRVLFLSFAGWSAVVSLFCAVISLYAALGRSDFTPPKNPNL